jgi:hypothetical protein
MLIPAAVDQIDMAYFRIDFLGVCAAIGHTALALAIRSQRFEGSWGGFLLFVIDFPASLFFLAPGVSGSWTAMIVIGGTWWYLIGFSVHKLIDRIKAGSS